MPTTPPAVPDADLLARFAATRDDRAFAELVRRHGPLAHGVCRRVTSSPADADDAYQAVLIVLARKGTGVRDPGRLGPWLHGVALRCARRVRDAAAARRGREEPMPDLPARAVDADWADVRPVLDAEVDRLPDHLRAALVLCELQGVGRAEAAARLGVAEGTVSSRLARAKDALRGRLTRRGVTLSAAGLAAVLTRAQIASAALPAAGTPSAAALAAAAHAETTMFLSHGLVKLVLALLTAAGLTAAGVGLLPADPPVPPAAPAKPSSPARESVADAKAKLAGEWRVVSLKNAGKDLGRPATLWTFTSDTLRHESRTNGYRLDPAATPKRFDILDRAGVAAGGEPGSAPGVYKLDGDTLTIHVHNTAVGLRETAVNRPAGFAPVDDPGAFLYVLERIKPDAADERVKLGGTWLLHSVTVDGVADKAQPLFSPYTFADGRVARPGGAGDPAFTVDPAASPKHLDTTDAEPGGGPASLGIYKLDGDTLTWHAGKFGAARPADFEPAKPGTGSTLLVFRRERPTEPPVGIAGTGSVSGHVTIGGKSGFGTEGRVTVYHGSGNTRFSGARLVGGSFRIDHIPAGEHGVEIEVETGAGKRTETRAVTVAAGTRHTMTFDLKPK